MASSTVYQSIPSAYSHSVISINDDAYAEKLGIPSVTNLTCRGRALRNVVARTGLFRGIYTHYNRPDKTRPRISDDQVKEYWSQYSEVEPNTANVLFYNGKYGVGHHIALLVNSTKEHDVEDRSIYMSWSHQRSLQPNRLNLWMFSSTASRKKHLAADLKTLGYPNVTPLKGLDCDGIIARWNSDNFDRDYNIFTFNCASAIADLIETGANSTQEIRDIYQSCKKGRTPLTPLNIHETAVSLACALEQKAE